MANEKRFHNQVWLDAELRRNIAGVLPESHRGNAKATPGISSVLDLIEKNSKNFPDKQVYNWINKTGSVVESYTYSDLWTKIESVAWHIRTKWGAKRGDMVLLCYPPGLDFVFAHFGCLLADALLCQFTLLSSKVLAPRRAWKNSDSLPRIADPSSASRPERIWAS